ncbi:hypothetical protein Tco_1078712, partial [Tanacetum coccineum]
MYLKRQNPEENILRIWHAGYALTHGQRVTREMFLQHLGFLPINTHHWPLYSSPLANILSSLSSLFSLEEVIYMRHQPGYEQDDMLIACKSKAESRSTKSLLRKEFDMKELRESKKIGDRQGLKSQDSEGVIIRDFLVRDCDVERMSKVQYAILVGSLMYLMVCMRQDITYAVTLVRKYLTNLGFVDSDYSKDPNKGESITSYAFLVHGCVESIWIKGLLKELGVDLNTVAANCDNHDAVEAKMVEVVKVGTEHNAVDALT